VPEQARLATSENRMRLLILGSPFDTVARGLGERMRRRHGDAAVAHRTLEDLAAARWVHRLGAAGVATDVTFADGTSLTGFAPTTVFNRLEFVPTLLFTRMATRDRDYARTEFYALALSWLNSLGEIVVNRPAPSGLAGPNLRAWQWMSLAARVGLLPFPAAATTSARHLPPPAGAVPRSDLMPMLDSPDLAQLGFDRPMAHSPPPASRLHLLVLGERVIGDASEFCGHEIAERCAQLADAAATQILEVELARLDDDPRWRFVTADARPRFIGDAGLDALTDWLDGRHDPVRRHSI
jgi:hypothetical protein